MQASVTGDAPRDEAVSKSELPIEKQDEGVQEKPAITNDPPDGGLRAWSCVAGSSLILLVTFGYVNAFGVYQAFYTGEAAYLPNKNAADISWIGSLQTFLMFSVGMISGPLFDAGYFRLLVLTGSVLYTICLMMLSLAEDYYSVFLAQGLGIGLSLGLLLLPSIGVISHWFKRRRALATGFVVAGSSIGGIIFPIMLNNMFNGSLGFAWGVRVSAFVVMGCLALANVLMRTRLPGRKRSAGSPKKITYRALFSDGGFLLVLAGAFWGNVGLFYPFFYLQVYSRQQGLSNQLSFYTLAILNGASFFGRIFPNFAADKFGILNLMVPLLALSAMLVWVLLACNNAAGIVCFAVFYGFTSGSYVSMIPGSSAAYANNVSEIGVRLGLTFFASGIGALIGNPVVGYILGDDYRWALASTWSGVTLLIGVLCFGLSRQVLVKRRGTWKV